MFCILLWQPFQRFIYGSIIHTYLHHPIPCVNRCTKKIKTNHDKKHSRKSRGFHSFIFSNKFRRISFVIDELKILYLHLRSMWTMGNVRERFFHRILKTYDLCLVTEICQQHGCLRLQENDYHSYFLAITSTNQKIQLLNISNSNLFWEMQFFSHSHKEKR